jgi:hypothetical protein
MIIDTEWDNDQKTVMRVTYHTDWTWDDLVHNLPTEKAFLDSVNHRVDVIADFRNTELPPGAVSHLPRIANSPPYTHANAGMVVMVGSPFFMEEVVDIYRKVYGQAAQKLHLVASVEAARVLLAQPRPQATGE